MIFSDTKVPKKFHLEFPKFNLQQALSTIHSHCSSFLHENKLQNLQSTFSNLQSQAKTSIDSTFSNLPFQNQAAFARIASPETTTTQPTSVQMKDDPLGGVPVYGLSNSSNEFILIAGGNSGKSVGLFCFREEDAQLLLEEVKNTEPSIGEGSKIVPVSLSKVLDLKLDGVAFRLIPEAIQIKHALEERKKAGIADSSFSGIPVFQSKKLVLTTPQKKYRPVFFRKEDLENSLTKAAAADQSNMRVGNVQVDVLEDVVRNIKGLSESNSEWNDVVFIPPGWESSSSTSESNAKPM